jgi:secreted trypsin-like serine protease
MTPRALYDGGVRASQWRGAAGAALCVMLIAAGIVAAPAAAAPKAGKAIIGGSVADPAAWPFEAAILRKGRLHCGGSVIAPTKILTAGHCVLWFGVAQLSVVTGRATLSDAASGQLLPVASAAVHPDFANTMRHDVAVITLGSPTAAPRIALPTPEQAAAATAPGTLLRVAGWGSRHPLGGALANTLRKTTERVRVNKRCRRAYRSFYSGASMVCAMGKRLRKYKRAPIHSTACSGDSGGPLVADAPTPIVVGTVSFGSPVCGFAPSPTVYSRVGDSLPFIQGAL